MHDIKAIRENFEAFQKAMGRRRLIKAGGQITQADANRRQYLAQAQGFRTERNGISDHIAKVRREGLADTSNLEAQSLALKGQIESAEKLAKQEEEKVDEIVKFLPNILDDDVPDGTDERANRVELDGEPRDLGFPARQHFELGEALGMMDFAAAAKLAGSRFTVLRGPLARLERALGQFMIDLHTREHGYSETSVPLLVREAAVYGTGQLPKFAHDLFQTTDGRWLTPTAEVPLTNMVADEILPAASLPIRVTALTDCFRSEAGAAGRDTRGMMRQHQFRKVELVSIVRPDESAAEHKQMTRAAERVLELLKIPYRRMLLCAGDTGFSAAKTFDLEVWLPGQEAWREISSCSNCRDFQARRMNARFRGPDGKVAGFVHTLNGSGVAVGRALIAVMENYQQADGSILIPDVLKPYMGGLERIERG